MRAILESQAELLGSSPWPDESRGQVGSSSIEALLPNLNEAIIKKLGNDIASLAKPAVVHVLSEQMEFLVDRETVDNSN